MLVALSGLRSRSVRPAELADGPADERATGSLADERAAGSLAYERASGSLANERAAGSLAYERASGGQGGGELALGPALQQAVDVANGRTVA